MEAAAVEQGKQDVIARLRTEIRRVQAAPRRYLMELATGVEALDSLGAFRLGNGVELSGEEGSGRATVALSLVAAACREQRLCAWVDGPKELYPPAAVSLGVELDRLLIVRPREPGKLVWTAVQLLRSGAFTCVVLDVTHTGVRLGLTDSRKLQEAARAGGALLLLITSSSAPGQGLVRFEMRAQGAAPRHLRVVEAPEGEEEEVAPTGWALEVTHSARGGMGRRVEVPAAALARRRPRLVRRRVGPAAERPRMVVGEEEVRGAPGASASPLISSARPLGLNAESGLGGVRSLAGTPSVPPFTPSGVEGAARTASTAPCLSGESGVRSLEGTPSVPPFTPSGVEGAVRTASTSPGMNGVSGVRSLAGPPSSSPFTPSGVEGATRAASTPPGLNGAPGLALSVVPPPVEPGPAPHVSGFGYGSRPGRDMPLVLSRDWR